MTGGGIVPITNYGAAVYRLIRVSSDYTVVIINPYTGFQQYIYIYILLSLLYTPPETRLVSFRSIIRRVSWAYARQTNYWR